MLPHIALRKSPIHASPSATDGGGQVQPCIASICHCSLVFTALFFVPTLEFVLFETGSHVDQAGLNTSCMWLRIILSS